MDHERVTEFVNLLIASHGEDAEKVARQRVKKYLDRGDAQWAQLYNEVAEEIARRQPRR